MPVIACPKPSELKDYMSGRLEPAAMDAMDSHVESCSACEQALGRLEDEPDTLVELLQQDETDAEVVPGESTGLLAEASIRLVESGEVASYQLIRRLGSGGMGRVYLARHTKLDKEVAIKILPPLAGYEQEFVARFEREMRAAGRLEHPAIVRTTDAGEHDGVHYLVMDVIDGLDLSQVASAVGRLEIEDACEVVRQAASGLAHAHELGIVHRDVKPSNLMLDPQGHVRILDFGLAQMDLWEKGSAEITTVGQLMGTLDYMAPEQAERGGAVDYRADLYALGATLFRLITGRAPLAAAPDLTPLEKLRLLSTHSAPKLSTLRSDVPEDLERLVSTMLDRDPSRRPASASHIAEALEPFTRSDGLPPLLEKARSQQKRGTSSLPAEMMSVLAAAQGEGDDAVRKGRGFFWPAVACCMAGLLALGGILFIIETSKGQLVIDSQEANVTVKLRKDGKVARELTIEPGRQSTKLWGGEYEIEIDSPSDRFTLSHDKFSILRGEIVIATIQPKLAVASPSASAGDTLQSAPEPPALADERLNQIVYEGETLDTWLRRLKFEKSVEQQNRALTAILALAQPELNDIVDPPMLEFALAADAGTSHDSWMKVLQILLATSEGNLLAHKQLFTAPISDRASESWALVLREKWFPLPADEETRDFVLDWVLDRIAKSNRGPSQYYFQLLDSMVRSNEDATQVERYLELIGKAEAKNAVLRQRLLDEFWLWDVKARPGDGYLVETLNFRNAALRYAVEQLDESSDIKIRVRAWLLIVKFADQEFPFDDDQLSNIGHAAARLSARSAQTPDWRDEQVSISDGGSRTRGVRYKSAETEVDAALRVLSKTEALKYCREELSEFHARLADLPIHLGEIVGNLLGQLESRARRVVRTDEDWQAYAHLATYFVQSGRILGIADSQLRHRFAEVRESDRQRFAKEAIAELNAGELSSLALTHLSPKDGPEAVDALVKCLISDEDRSTNPLALELLLKLTGKQFLSKFVEVHGQTDEYLYFVRLSRVPSFSCESLDELQPLLGWASKKFASDIETASKRRVANVLRDLCRDRTFPKPSNTQSAEAQANGLVSDLCQRSIIELLDRQDFLEDPQFWLELPVIQGRENGEIEYKYDVAWQQKVLRCATAVLKNSESRSIRAQALACIRSVLGAGGNITAEQKVELGKCLASRIEEAFGDFDLACTVDGLKYWFGPWVVPKIEGVSISGPTDGRRDVPVSELVLTLQVIKELELRDSMPDGLLTRLVDQASERVELRSTLSHAPMSRTEVEVEWESFVRPRDFAHLIAVMAGEMLGRDVSELLKLPEEKQKIAKLKEFNQVRPGDTLAIYIEAVLPMDKQPLPVMQAGTNSPVVGYPVPVHSSGEIVLPLVGRLKVADMQVTEVRKLIEETYVSKDILTQPVLSVEMLAKAGSNLEIRALTTTTPPPIKTAPEE